MVNRYNLILSFLIFLGLLTLSSNLLAQVTASVDRTTINIDDTFVMTLRIGKTSRSSLDLTGLENDFEILGTSQSSQFVLRNGRNESFTEWRVDLAPKREGVLIIPPIRIEGESTKAIRINVKPSTSGSAGNALPQAVYLETSVDKNSAYVQEQILFTVRIFHAVQLDDLSLTPLEFNDTPIKQFEDTSFRRRINGMLYQVHERRYAIYPQQSGELTIPSLTFAARQITSQQRFGFRSPRGKPVRKNTEAITITVNEIPASFSGGFWLPATDINIEEQWSGDLDQIRVGDSITRTTTLRAEGLMFSQLPETSDLKLSNAQIYPDQGENKNLEASSGIIAERIEKQAIIPIQTGNLVIPEQRIVWWNTVKDREETTVIPTKNITVLPGLLQQPQLPASASTTAQPSPAPATQTQMVTNPFWIWATVIALGLWAITLMVLLWVLRNNNNNNAAPDFLTKQNRSHSEKQAYKVLCQQLAASDPPTIRKALIDWAKEFYDQEVYSLNDVIELTHSTELKNFVEDMNRAKYSGVTDKQWNAEGLVNIINSVRQARKKSATDNPLPDLYQAAS